MIIIVSNNGGNLQKNEADEAHPHNKRGFLAVNQVTGPSQFRSTGMQSFLIGKTSEHNSFYKTTISQIQ